MENQIISQEGLDKLKEELEHKKTITRREIADRIQKAKDMGDLSENAEYSEAKDAQAFNDGRIAELTAMIKNLTVIDTEKNKNTIGMGSQIITELEGEEKRFTIVSFNESDPINGMISNESPLGKSFLGKNKGSIVVVKTPKGAREYIIKQIQ